MAAKFYYHRDPNGRINTSRMTLRSFPASANINRHTGKPHEHKREIARNLRRATFL